VAEPMAMVRSFAETVLSERCLAGLAVAVTDRDGLLDSAGFGLADLERGAPVMPETRFEIGSIGKTFTAVALLQLAEENRLDLAAPATEYLPWFDAGPGHAITMRELLTHSSGLIEGADLSADSRFDVWALRHTPRAEPGRFHYSNVGYRALGYVLEELTAKRYPEVVSERILQPLGMHETDAAITHETRRNLAVGYTRWYDDRPPRRDHPLAPATWLETDTGDGSIAASAPELARFARLLLDRGEPLLSPESFELLTERTVRADEGSWYGHGAWTTVVDGRPLVGHGGSMPGFGSTLLADVEAGLAAVVLVNGPDEGDLTELVAVYALDALRAAAAGARLPEPPVYDPLRVESAAEYAGRYEGPGGGLTVEAEGDRLMLERGAERLPIEPRAADRFFVPHDDLSLFCLVFCRERDTVVEAWHGADRYVPAGAEAAALAGLPAEWRPYPGHYRAANPWLENFRVVARGDRLRLVFPWGPEEPLEPLGEGVFRWGEEDWWPERLRFDAVAGGEALRANLSGCDYYRVATP
jgi:D-alanyl-D-alanine carboxypeptidase